MSDTRSVEFGEERVGGSTSSIPSLLRVASGLQIGANSASSGYGFRLTRTLGPGTVPTRATLPDGSATE